MWSGWSTALKHENQTLCARYEAREIELRAHVFKKNYYILYLRTFTILTIDYFSWKSSKYIYFYDLDRVRGILSLMQ